MKDHMPIGFPAVMQVSKVIRKEDGNKLMYIYRKSMPPGDGEKARWRCEEPRNRTNCIM